ncbi:MAG: iron ABC transporter permease [Trueperaceae bacterium]|nr:MAG: iron ABC transporter permease [Trueperaceae bacterium]
MTRAHSVLGWWLGVGAASFLALFLAYPLTVILWHSIDDLGALLRAASNPYYRERLWFTTYQALLSTGLTVILALPAGLLLGRYDFAGKRLLRSALTIPFVMPTVVVAIGFLALMGPRGLIGFDLRGSFGIILFAHVFYNYAVVVRIVSSFLETLTPRLREAAALLGAGPWRVLFRITLPLAWPAILAAATLVFIFCFTSFGVILILAPQPAFATLEIEIYRLTARLLQLDTAAVLVLAQLLVIALFARIYTRLQARLALPLASHTLPLASPKGWAKLQLGLNISIAILLILSPLLALTYQAFWPSGGLFPELKSFRSLADTPRTIGFAGAGQAILNSLRFATASTLLALFVGFSFAYAVVRAGWRWLDNLSLLPLATSAVTLGFGYLLVFPQLTVSAWGITLAHALIGFPFVTRALLPALRSLSPTLLQAARTLGASPTRILLRIELPLLLPAFITAASFAFAISMGEFGATLVITRPEYATLPMAIFDRLGRPGAANYGSALALSVILMAITGGVMLLLERFGRSEL